MKGFLTLLIFCFSNAYSQMQLEVVFPKGNQDSVPEIYKYTDYIIPSKDKLELSLAPNNESTLKVNLDINKPSELLIVKGAVSRKFIVQPNNNYQIVLSENKFEVSSEDSINIDLDSADIYIQRFYDKIFELESQKSKELNKQVLSLLQNLTDKLNMFKGSTFQNQMIKYKLAESKAVAFDVIKDKIAYRQLATEYILNDEVLFQNPAYMVFLFDYYYRWFRNFAWYEKKFADVEFDFEIMKSIVNDIPDRTIRQLTLINFAKDTYGSGKIKYSSEIIDILDSLSRCGMQKQIKQASSSLAKQFSTLQIGSPLPGVKYYDLEGEEFNLYSIDSKYILLDFWFIGCKPCQMSIPYMNKLYEEYGDCLEIISINDIDDAGDIKKYKTKENIDRIFLTGNKYDESFSLLNVHYYPTFYLIDRYGKIILMPKNSGSVREQFESIENALLKYCL
jgi:thiol-disulfide isomerase/thioredoxin